MIIGYLCAAITLVLLLNVIGYKPRKQKGQQLMKKSIKLSTNQSSIQSKEISAKKSTKQSVNILLKKIHKPLGYLIVLASIAHLIITIPVWGQRAVWVIVTGIITALLFVWMIVTYIMRKQWKMLWIKSHRVGACLIGLFLVLHVATYFIDFGSYKEKIKNIQLTGVSAEGVADGIYNGEYDVGYIYAEVEVTVADEKIVNVRLLQHKNERGIKAESLVTTIVEEQTTEVDSISGATNSSKVICKAVENALKER